MLLWRRGGTEKGASKAVLILVVDDEEDVRSYLARLLAPRCHQVLTASGPTQARQLAESQAFDVLITDIDMEGGSSGIALANDLLERNPAMRVVYMSGSDHVRELPDGAIALHKPFASAELLEVVADFAAKATSRTALSRGARSPR